MKDADHSHGPDMVIDIGKPVNFTGGLEFFNLTYTVMKKKKDINGKWVKQEADLLHSITGYAAKGCVTAVMGPSGAGKSTFLDGLAGRIASGSLTGRVSLDGVDVSPSLIKRTSAYIMQDDRLFPMLTVYETLMFAADFRLGSISRADKRQRVEQLIEQLGLSVCHFKTIILSIYNRILIYVYYTSKRIHVHVCDLIMFTIIILPLYSQLGTLT